MTTTRIILYNRNRSVSGKRVLRIDQCDVSSIHRLNNRIGRAITRTVSFENISGKKHDHRQTLYFLVGQAPLSVYGTDSREASNHSQIALISWVPTVQKHRHVICTYPDPNSYLQAITSILFRAETEPAARSAQSQSF